jgi:hypothetical protein
VGTLSVESKQETLTCFPLKIKVRAVQSAKELSNFKREVKGSEAKRKAVKAKNTVTCEINVSDHNRLVASWKYTYRHERAPPDTFIICYNIASHALPNTLPNARGS